MTTRRVKSKATPSPSNTPRGKGGKQGESPVSPLVPRMGEGKVRRESLEGVKMVTFKCPECGSKVRAVSAVVSAVCDANGKHRQKQMVRS